MRGNTTPRQSWKRMYLSSSLSMPVNITLLSPRCCASRRTSDSSGPPLQPPLAVGYAQRHPSEYAALCSSGKCRRRERTYRRQFPASARPSADRAARPAVPDQTGSPPFYPDIFQGLAGSHIIGRRGNDAIYAAEKSLLQRLVQLH